MYEDAPLAPLLSYYNSSKLEGGAENDAPLGVDEQNSQHIRLSLSEVAEEIKQLYILAIPMIITGLFIYGKSIISMFFMGKLGKETLAGGSLAISVANISGYSVISGLALVLQHSTPTAATSPTTATSRVHPKDPRSTSIPTCRLSTLDDVHRDAPD